MTAQATPLEAAAPASALAFVFHGIKALAAAIAATGYVWLTWLDLPLRVGLSLAGLVLVGYQIRLARRALRAVPIVAEKRRDE